MPFINSGMSTKRAGNRPMAYLVGDISSKADCEPTTKAIRQNKDISSQLD